MKILKTSQGTAVVGLRKEGQRKKLRFENDDEDEYFNLDSNSRFSDGEQNETFLIVRITVEFFFA